MLNHQVMFETVEKLITSDNQVMVLSAPTGSGKSTALIQVVDDNEISTLLLMPTRANVFNAYKDAKKRGLDVGYQVGNEQEKDIDANLVFMTYGKFFSNLRYNKSLEEYDLIIADEADYLLKEELRTLAYLIRQRKQNQAIRLVLTSATLDIKFFSEKFNIPKEGIINFDISQRYRKIDIEYSEYSRTRFNGYVNTAYNKAMSWIDSSETPEVMLIVLPTYSSVDAVVGLLSARLDQDIEIRTITGQMSEDEINQATHTPPARTHLVFVATEVIARAINFGPEVNIVSVVESGLRNRQRYDVMTRRNMLSVAEALYKRLHNL
jgi:HrpA-like RNA helicase